MAACTNKAGARDDAAWRRVVRLFLSVFVGALALVYLFILLVDPYDLVPFSLPMERPLVSGSQRYAYPQVMRSRRYDALIIGTSTSRLIDPQALNGPFKAHFANMAMNAGTAWEQWTAFEYFRRVAGAPKVLIVAGDGAWCEPNADTHRVTSHGFPEWLYDDSRLNDFVKMFSSDTVEVAARLIGYHLGWYRARSRYDGFEVFTPPENEYDLVRARRGIWRGGEPRALPDLPPPQLSEAERRALKFPALDWMQQMFTELPQATRKVVAFMPVHVTAQAWPGTRAAAVEAECKARIAAVARRHGATMIDWRIASPITREDSNYWDSLHYRLAVAQRVARELVAAVVEGAESPDGDYRLVVK